MFKIFWGGTILPYKNMVPQNVQDFLGWDYLTIQKYIIMKNYWNPEFFVSKTIHVPKQDKNEAMSPFNCELRHKNEAMSPFNINIC